MTANADATEYLNIEEASTLLRVHPSAVYEAIKRGLPARKVGKCYRVHREELRSWFAGSAHTPALVESLAPVVASQVLAALGEAFADLGRRIDADARHDGHSR